jgi:hypothetical protein
LVLKILPHAMSVQARDRADVLGTAALDEKGVGFYGYAFYDRIQRLAEGRRLSPTLLGHVLAHEIGHLLYDRFHARDVAPEQARTLFDVALGEFLFLAEPAKAVPNNHGGIIPLRRVEGMQGDAGSPIGNGEGVHPRPPIPDVVRDPRITESLPID